jgi:hypothetical protein
MQQAGQYRPEATGAAAVDVPRGCRQDGDQSDGGQGVVVAAAALPASVCTISADALADVAEVWEASRCMNVTIAGLL